MKIEICECVGMKNSLFTDLSQYTWIEDWILAVVQKITVFMPDDLTIVYQDQKFEIVKDKVISERSFEMVQFLQALPGRVRRIPSERLYIQVNGFEKSLFIDLDHWEDI